MSADWLYGGTRKSASASRWQASSRARVRDPGPNLEVDLTGSRYATRFEKPFLVCQHMSTEMKARELMRIMIAHHAAYAGRGAHRDGDPGRQAEALCQRSGDFEGGPHGGGSAPGDVPHRRPGPRVSRTQEWNPCHSSVCSALHCRTLVRTGRIQDATASAFARRVQEGFELFTQTAEPVAS
jgi:hypothetical protein